MSYYLDRHWQVSQPELHDKIHELLTLTGGAKSDNASYYKAMLWSLVHLIQADLDRWDAKIVNYTLRDLNKALTTLQRYKRRRKATVYGSARTTIDMSEYALAKELGKQLAHQGFMVMTGAGGGIMHAAQEGAGAENSLGLNIALPFEQDANPVIANSPALIRFRFFFLRKLFFVKEADALVVFPGGFGTHDELSELLTLVQTGKSPLVPIILMDTPDGGYWKAWMTFVRDYILRYRYIDADDFNLFELATSAEEALDIITRFYSNFHSLRWIGKELRLRLLRPLPPEAIEQLNQDFAHICQQGEFIQTDAHIDEQDEPELDTLSRLAFQFNARDYGQLRQVINWVNRY